MGGRKEGREESRAGRGRRLGGRADLGGEMVVGFVDARQSDN